MAYCVKCGTMVGDDVRFCPQCGEEIPKTGSQDTGQAYYSSAESGGSAGGYGSAEAYGPAGSYDKGEYFDPAEVKANKAMGVLSYLGILVLIPLIVGDRASEYVRHHANQGLVLFLASTVIDLLDGDWRWGFHSLIRLDIAGLSWLLDVADLACVVMMIAGIVYACKGKRTELPLIGKIKFWR